MPSNTIVKNLYKTYQNVVYPTYIHSQTHPNYLATHAILAGMSPPPPTHCRFLELGCAGGGNIVPIAYTLPQANFVGLDFSDRAIDMGREMATNLGVNNIEFIHANLLDMDESLGMFDYIVAHGVYSWVPETVRNKILAIIQQYLAPQGVAFISYNTYPGWHMLQTVRDLMLYNTEHIDEPVEKMKHVRQLLQFMAENLAGDKPTVYSNFITQVNALIEQVNDGYVLHDFLELVNHPVYFKDFIAHAKQYKLQYLANAEFNAVDETPSKVVLDKVQALATDKLAFEQHLDFMINCQFRQTLLCHQAIDLNYQLAAQGLINLYIASRVKPKNVPIDINSTTVDVFYSSKEVTLSTSQPLSKAALVYLQQQWPLSVPFTELLNKSLAMLNINLSSTELTEEVQIFSTNLLRAFEHDVNLIALHTYTPPLMPTISQYPIASPIARFQLANNWPVSNLYHQRVEVGLISSCLLNLMDGSRDREMLLDTLVLLVDQGQLTLEQEGETLTDKTLIKQFLANELDNSMQQIAAASLLVG